MDGNRIWNKLKGVAGEAIAARIAYNNFARDLSTMNVLGDKFQWFNDPAEVEGLPGGTFDYMLTASFNKSNMSPGTELPEWHLTLFNAAGQLASERTFNLSSPRKFLFEIKTLGPDSSNLSNIVKGFNQAIANAELNPGAYSILMIDK